MVEPQNQGTTYALKWVILFACFFVLFAIEPYASLPIYSSRALLFYWQKLHKKSINTESNFQNLKEMIICVIALIGKFLICKVFNIVILLILVLVSANMMGQVNDAPPMSAFSAFYDSGQADQHTSRPSSVTKSWIADKPKWRTGPVTKNGPIDEIVRFEKVIIERYGKGVTGLNRYRCN